MASQCEHEREDVFNLEGAEKAKTHNKNQDFLPRSRPLLSKFASYGSDVDYSCPHGGDDQDAESGAEDRSVRADLYLYLLISVSICIYIYIYIYI